MIDQRDVERAAERFRPPEASFERLTLRRERKRRDRRIRAGVVGGLVAVAVGWWGVQALRSPPVPAGPPVKPVDLGIFEPVADHIVYRGPNGIFGVDPSAPEAEPVQLTPDAWWPIGWSSDGTELLVMREFAETLSILHADGSETPVPTEGRTIQDAAIAPDGSRVVIAGATATADGECCSPGLYVVDADGGPAQILLGSADDMVYDPTFSPDGTQIAYATGAGDHSHHIWVMNADGSDAHEIVFNETTSGAGHVNGLAWSPAGDLIALGIDTSGIYTFAPDGSGFTRVTRTGNHPYWSPDGSQIAFSLVWPYNDGQDPGPLAVMDADGSDVREFDLGTAGPWHPAGPIAPASRDRR